MTMAETLSDQHFLLKMQWDFFMHALACVILQADTQSC